MDQDRWTKKLHKPFVMNFFPEREALKVTASHLMTDVYCYPKEHRFSSKSKNYHHLRDIISILTSIEGEKGKAKERYLQYTTKKCCRMMNKVKGPNYFLGCWTNIAAQSGRCWTRNPRHQSRNLQRKMKPMKRQGSQRRNSPRCSIPIGPCGWGLDFLTRRKRRRKGQRHIFHIHRKC